MRARKVILFSLDFQMSQTKLFHYIILFVVMYLLNRKRNECVWEWSTTGRGLSTKRLRSLHPWRYSKLDWTSTWTTQSSETSFQLAYIITGILLNPSCSDSAIDYLTLLFYSPRQLRTLLPQAISFRVAMQLLRQGNAAFICVDGGPETAFILQVGFCWSHSMPHMEFSWTQIWFPE